MLRPGPELFRRVGGIHKFMGWSGRCSPTRVAIRSSRLPEDRTITEEGARFRSYVDQRMHMLSPERSIEMQTAIGSDIMMVLDVCIDSTSDEAQTRAAMERTHRWALRSLAARTNPAQALFAIVQGGVVPALRRESAAFFTAASLRRLRASVGWRSATHARSARTSPHFSAELLPADRPRYLMGVGTPPDLLHAMLAGVDMFDCVLPTHLGLAGHGVHLDRSRARHARGRARAPTCRSTRRARAATCRRFSRAYLHHLFKCSEPLGPRLLVAPQPAPLSRR